MATVRKLQAEIDKTFRKVDEQQEVFQQVFDRLHECDQSLKEKYEVRLLILYATTRFFPRNWNAQLFCHDARVDLSLSLSADFIATFFCAATTRLGGLLLWVHSFFLRRCVFSNVFCGQTQARFLVHHNFRPNGKRGISL